MQAAGKLGISGGIGHTFLVYQFPLEKYRGIL
jgi:hypothetical protein